MHRTKLLESAAALFMLIITGQENNSFKKNNSEEAILKQVDNYTDDDDENLNYTGYSELFNITAWIKLEEKKKPNKLIPKLNFICKNLVRGPKCPD